MLDGTGFYNTDTSFGAAKAISASGRGELLRQRVERVLRDHGPMTADECADRIGEDRLAVRPRLSELFTAGRIVDSKKRRSNASGRKAIVFEINPDVSSK